MSRLEQAFAAELERSKVDGKILWWRFEPMTFRLAPKTSYTPDFAVQMPDGELIMYEVKGFWTSAARTKIKVAAAMFPLRFVGAMRKRVADPWSMEEFSDTTTGDESEKEDE